MAGIVTQIRQSWARMVAFFRKSELEQEFDQELASHIEISTQEYVRRGMSLPEARRRALIELGGIEASKQVHRESRGLPWLDGILQDIRFAVRSLRRTPGVTVVAVATLAIGIGVNAAVFTLTDTVLFKGFPLVNRNDRILYISGRGGASYPDFLDWRAQAKSFEGMAAVADFPVSISGDNSYAESYSGTRISAGGFALVRQQPILGRDFSPTDETQGAAPVVILSYNLWERRYLKNPAIVGQSIHLNGVPTTIIGVMPRGFTFPQRQDLWTPLIPGPDLQKRDARGLWFAFGRMQEGTTVASVRAEIDTIGKRLASEYPATNRGYLPNVRTFAESFIGVNAAVIYGSLWGAVIFVLLIACANLANLMLARAVSRSREISVRIALGAGRWRIIRQLLLESLMLSGLGGAFGWWIATGGVRIYTLVAAPPSWFENVLDYSMDDRVFAYLVAISIGTGILFGLVPALRLSRLDVNSALKDGGRGSRGSGARGSRLSALLVTGEMALAVMLLAGAGVIIHSFLNMYTADLGVQTRNVLTMQLSLPDARYPTANAKTLFFSRLRMRLEEIPGMESVALANHLPIYGADRIPYQLAGSSAPEQNSDNRQRPMLSALVISPVYFRTLGAATLSGRDFSDADAASAPPVAIVNQKFASLQWPGESPLGKRLRLFPQKTSDAAKQEQWLTVVGMVSNIVQAGPTQPELDSLIYLPYQQKPLGFMFVIARTRITAAAVAGAIRRETQTMDPELPISWFMPLADRLSWTYAFNGSIAVLFLVFAAIALLLASVGLYAVIAHAVGERTQEIGVRMALGGTARDIRTFVLKRGMLSVGIGLAVGLVASLAVNRLLRAELVQVSPSDPITLLISVVVLMLAALCGCLIPARRAMRVDPVVALRND